MAQIQLRRDTSANWTTNNPTPASGEPCYETDTGKLKVGNGTTPYNSLLYYGSDYTAGEGITINGKTLAINTSPTQYFPIIPDGSSGTRFEGNLLIQPNNIEPISEPAGRCGCCNIPIDMDSFSEIEFVVKLMPTNINGADCRYCQLFTDTNYYARFWFDSYGGKLRAIVFGGDGVDLDDLALNADTNLSINQWYYVRFLITPTNITAYYKTSDAADWSQLQSINRTVNSSTFKPDLEGYPFTFYIGGTNANDSDGTGSIGTSAAAAKYDLSESFVRIDDTVYPMLLGTNNAIANTEHVGLVQPDGSTITITNEGTISAVIPDNLVTTDTEQTITGTKTFETNLVATQYNATTADQGYSLNGTRSLSLQTGVGVVLGDQTQSLNIRAKDAPTLRDYTIDNLDHKILHEGNLATSEIIVSLLNRVTQLEEQIQQLSTNIDAGNA